MGASLAESHRIIDRPTHKPQIVSMQSKLENINEQTVTFGSRLPIFKCIDFDFKFRLWATSARVRILQRFMLNCERIIQRVNESEASGRLAISATWAMLRGGACKVRGK